VTLSRRALLRRAARLALGAAFGGAVVSAFAGATARAAAPRAVAPTTDRCPACGMAVLDARYAATAHTAGGRTLVYDAIECLADHLNGHAGEAPTIAAAFLADRAASSREAAFWLPADAAAILHHPRLRTPMGGGLAAFADDAAARAFADAQRLPDPELMPWSAVLERGRAAPWVPLV
jgi:copper chaperone NosL